MTRLLLALAVVLSIPANAAIYGFTCIPASGGGCAVNAASQLTVDVTSSTIGANSAVSFLFRNIGTIDSVITDIYWDDRTSAANAANQYLNFGINAVGGTAATQGVSYQAALAFSGNLPRGSTLTPAFSEDANAAPTKKGGVANNGIQDGSAIATADALEVRIGLLNSTTLANVLTGLNNGTLRIGFHLQGLDCTGVSSCQTSDAYVNNGPVPEPGAYLVLGLGLSTLLWVGRKRLAQRQ